ncbi:MAG TPA: GYDIA family GHMP kinase [Flavobacterium sp.]|nr:GYDIA family GHMP kinase [Flavobacterium sp.]
MPQTFYSNGKLLITGEYLVLDGAKALALPAKFGQNLVADESSGKAIQWKSFDNDASIWFEDLISFTDIIEKAVFGNPIKDTLIEILHEAHKLNPEFLESKGYSITTALTFPKLWGLGTSSTLISNIAQWLKIDAFELLRNSFGGSGYDIACAQNDTPIVYALENGNPIVETVRFNPEFSERLYFVYLNKKQSSKSAIASYKSNRKNLEAVIPMVNAITESILKTDDFAFFCSQLEKHENLLGEILQMPTVKENLFADFRGTVKSLGAWGGDFILAAAEEDPTAYFSAKGFETVIPFSQMIL